MTALLIVLMLVAFVLLDMIVRRVGRRMEETRIRREREKALDTAVRLDFTHDAKSLKRAEVPDARARILAVDDEPIVLDSFRRILVLDGFSVDTVESGPEALGLIQRHDYDFVFTDLKMPGMDGVEVVKAVKHLRPDIDVAVITGYGTIETAVETMQHGAVDYVQKPFTPEELSEFAKTLLIRRQARAEARSMPTVHIVAPENADAAPGNEYCVPGGAFVAPQHTWARIEPDGRVRVGLDDFVRKAAGRVDAVRLPEPSRELKRGEPLFSVKSADGTLRLSSPVSGRVSAVNKSLEGHASWLLDSPYHRGWVCVLEPSDLAGELPDLMIGRPVADWYREEIARLRTLRQTSSGGTAIDWATLEREFLAPRRPRKRVGA